MYQKPKWRLKLAIIIATSFLMAYASQFHVMPWYWVLANLWIGGIVFFMTIKLFWDLMNYYD